MNKMQVETYANLCFILLILLNSCLCFRDYFLRSLCPGLPVYYSSVKINCIISCVLLLLSSSLLLLLLLLLIIMLEIMEESK
jgi:hypothetical protein